MLARSRDLCHLSLKGALVSLSSPPPSHAKTILACNVRSAPQASPVVSKDRSSATRRTSLPCLLGSDEGCAAHEGRRYRCLRRAIYPPAMTNVFRELRSHTLSSSTSFFLPLFPSFLTINPTPSGAPHLSQTIVSTSPLPEVEQGPMASCAAVSSCSATRLPSLQRAAPVFSLATRLPF